MTREEKIEMFTMRVDGATLQECADKYGITRERVRQIFLNPYCDGLRKRVNPKKYKRHDLAETIVKKYGTLNKFSEQSGILPSTISKILNGRSVSSKTIHRFLKHTGLTYEEAFPDDEE